MSTEEEIDKVLDSFGIRDGNTELWFSPEVTEFKAALLAIIAEAIIDEHTVMNMRFTTVRGNTPKEKLKVEGYMICRDEWSRVNRERIAELQARGGKDTA